MVEDITATNCGNILNAAFRRYVKVCADIRTDFEAAVAQFGLEREPDEGAFVRTGFAARASELVGCGTIVANDGKSIHVGWISPSHVSCRAGVGAETFPASTQRHCNCYL